MKIDKRRSLTLEDANSGYFLIYHPRNLVYKTLCANWVYSFFHGIRRRVHRYNSSRQREYTLETQFARYN